MEQTQPNPPEPGTPKKRPPFLTTALPKRGEGRSVGWVASLVAHLLILLLLLAPVLLDSELIQEAAEGAGGAGPAGGGGGGTGGTGGSDDDRRVHEQLQYIQIAPPAPSPTVEPEPEVVEPIPVPPPPEVPQPEPEVVQPKVVELAQLLSEDGPRVVAGTGTGGGTGNDGTSGTGPGTGGGIGSGIGTGTGSGVGPGTGGGDGEIHPPTPIQVFLPPVPAPDKIKPFRLIAYFEVDASGKSRLLRFTESSDRGYNRELRSRLEAMRFRPAVRPDGTPVKQVYPFEIWIY